MKVSKLFSCHLITWPHFFSLLLEEKHENYVKLARSIKFFLITFFKLYFYLYFSNVLQQACAIFCNVRKPAYANIIILPFCLNLICPMCPSSHLIENWIKKQWGDFTNILMSLYGSRVAEWPTESLGTQEAVYWSLKIILSLLTSWA